MNKILFFLKLMLSVSILFAQNSPDNTHHSISVNIDIANSSMDVVDTIFLRPGVNNGEFLLNKELNIYYSSCELNKVSSSDGCFCDKYKFSCDKGKDYVVFKYKGKVEDGKETYDSCVNNFTWGTKGIIFDRGLFLNGSTYWIPNILDEALFTFDLWVRVPKKWNIVSQGNLVSNFIKEDLRFVHYFSDKPSNQICLAGNTWIEYSVDYGKVKITVFLLNEDTDLAQKYLGATGGYIRMYEEIIGEFPYEKFDIVENFWETGYGMPSFTLLGSKVIRFPWVLGTSYPHELLHNYWANSVYVDSKGGNWSEGITTYMADYLLKEKKGQGKEFRRSCLKKYTDYVNEANDFPVSDFISKTDNASEAIGYSKVLMMNHMLRVKYGNSIFKKAYSDFYMSNKFSLASFADIRNSFEKATGDNLGKFFRQWIDRKGAPFLKLGKTDIKRKDVGYSLTFDIIQSQEGDVFSINIPVYIYLEGSKIIEKRFVELDSRRKAFKIHFDKRPVRIEVDPYYEIMRKLDDKEVPPSLSSLMGTRKWTMVLPSESKDYSSYKMIAQGWVNSFKRRGKQINIIDDSDIKSLPSNGVVWVLGKNNALARNQALIKDYRSVLDKNELAKITASEKDDILIYSAKDSKNPILNIGYININDFSKASILFSKLMHYGNYSYLGFNNEDMSNILKGEFPVIDSPLNRNISPDENVVTSQFIYPAENILFK